MLFTAQKLIWFLLIPPASPMLLMLAGMLLITKRKLLGWALILCGFVALYLLSLGLTADGILKPLEGRYPPLRPGRVNADAVVVPGGGSVDLGWMNAEPVPNEETLSRLVVGVELAKRFKLPLVLCGGNGEPFATTVKDAGVMARAVSAMGMPPQQVIVENDSRNTLENSHAVRKLVKGDRIVLVTSAYHLPRAAAMFAKRGFTVIPAPAYFLAQKRLLSAASFIPKAVELSHSTVGIAEWISLAWWRVWGEY
jgi:uncharacterized SAM-binding protein YcdF (DUF218 family)